MAELVRSFVAFDIEDEEIRRKISDVQGVLAKTGAKLKLVDPNAIHLTIKFLGEIPRSLVEQAKQALREVKFKAFTIELAGLGAFPAQHRPSVIWIGVKKGVAELADIFKQVEPRMASLGIPPERREFSPHLTIARVKARSPRLAEALAKLADVEIGSVEAKVLRLKRSVLTQKGPIYSTLSEVRAR